MILYVIADENGRVIASSQENNLLGGFEVTVADDFDAMAQHDYKLVSGGLVYDPLPAQEEETIPPVLRGLHGVAAVTDVPAHSNKSENVAFSAPFAAPPTVIATPLGNDPYTRVVGAYGVTADGFKVMAGNESDGTMTVSVAWVAMGN